MEEIILEKEGDMPENWISEILIRDYNNNVIEVDIPDDKEG